jgi:hypothetical protein
VCRATARCGAFGWFAESVLAKNWYENSEQELARLVDVLERGDAATAADDAELGADESDDDTPSEPDSDDGESSTLSADELGLGSDDSGAPSSHESERALPASNGAAAQKDADRQIAEKKRKGYRETDREE